MEDPLEVDGKVTKKTDHDIEVIVHTDKILVAENCPIKDRNNGKNAKLCCIEDCDKHGIEFSALKTREGSDTLPHERTRITYSLRYSPSRSKKESHKKHGKSSSKASEAREMKTELIGKCHSIISRASSRSLMYAESKILQGNKSSKPKSENDYDRCSIENWSSNATSIDMNDNCYRLCRDMEKLKLSVRELIKVKRENCELKSQLAHYARDKASLLTEFQSKEDSMKSFTNSINKMKCECKCLLDEKDNKIQSLMVENYDLSMKVKELDMAITNINNEVEPREKYAKALAEEHSADVLDEQKCVWEEKLAEYKCIITEKDSYIQEIEEKYGELKVLYEKVEEESQRSLSAEKGSTESNIALQCKLSEAEKAREELQEKLALLENDNEEKVSKLRNSVRELEERNNKLTDTNEKLEELLRLYEANLDNNDSEGESDDLREIDALKEELEEARQNLEQVNREVQKRDNIILDFEDCVIKLKEQASQRIEELESIIKVKEKNEINIITSFHRLKHQNEMLLNELTKLKSHEKHLSHQLDETLQQLSEYEMENTEAEEAFIEHTLQLQEMEKEAEKKTEQWYSLITKISHERDIAISTARAAREKLSISLAEFQKHFAEQKRIQEALKGMLNEREYYLKVAVATIVESGYLEYTGDSNFSFASEP